MSVTYLYTIKHIDSGKIYVGKSIHPEKRWREHLYHVSIGKQTQICRAIRKHGVERFVFEILDVAETAEMANLMEVGYIRTLQTHDPAFGYNGRELYT